MGLFNILLCAHCPHKAGLLETGCLSRRPARACRRGSPPTAVGVPQMHEQHQAPLTVQEVAIGRLRRSTAQCPAEVPGLN